MLALWMREFNYLCKGIKSVVLLSLFVGFTYMIASLSDYFPFLTQNTESSSSLSGGLKFLILFFGFIFVSMVSHDTINKEIDTQTIRFLVTKTSRISIVLGKFLGILSFWILVTTLSYIPAVLKAQHIDFFDYLKLIQYLFVMVSVTIFLSSVVVKPFYSLLFGLCFGVVYPAVGMVSMIKEGFIWDQIRYISLFNYIKDTNGGLYFPFMASALLVILSIIVFQRRDL